MARSGRSGSSRQREASATAGSRTLQAIVGASTIPNVGKGTENQDAFVAAGDGTYGSEDFIGVFDGHGEMGGHISNLARSALKKHFVDRSTHHSDPRSALASAYRRTQDQIVREVGEDAEHSGTTAISAYRNRDQLVVANVGDSRAVLGRCGTGYSQDSRAPLRAMELSSDQKPSREDERRRILKEGGQVGQSLFPVRNVLGGTSFVRMGPERVMDSSGLGGLAMSRSLGDTCLHPYVSSKPELHARRLDRRDKVLILGSDGVWDHVSSQEAVNIAARHKDPNAAAREITGAARQRWAAETEGLLSDDITAVVMRLGQRPAAQSERSASLSSSRSQVHRVTPQRALPDQLRTTGKSRDAIFLPNPNVQQKPPFLARQPVRA
eukprot:TRINITY_DN39020_c0_g1_i1.p1 TRINITY_DN39020_c0_g1~~TRINITY_DN39020_c0_g1_i1.p1  ORF type:complete len:388 (-),score=56.73 TRINITY_DN39020_c0_g1_i1:18-1160(-)